ncbi:hypothetical protein [Mesorhizobium caraganae]|uniref:hypothetical protein n=1 Tax=Mesorhizobium caraganae TaxID=483206 RepID=UPI00333C48CD
MNIPSSPSNAISAGAHLTTQPEFETRTDVVPELWQFINGLRSDDLVAELIQNEIDAGSTHTVLTFEEDRFLCSGNGNPVDEDGWERLKYLRGAGDLVPRKRSMIGVKNHGLKACFKIGDDIFIRSNGRYAHQTLYKNGHDKPAIPAASQNYMADPTAPAGRGAVIEVRYRLRKIEVQQGEPIILDICSPELLANIFVAAASDIPARFMGTTVPGLRPKYTLDLVHHAFGRVQFTFQAGRPTARRGLKIYKRTCNIKSDAPMVASRSFHERVVSTELPVPKSGGDFPDFYREGKRIRIEVAWQEGSAGRPVPAQGHFRYPIAYADTGASAFTGIGAHYSAPFVSDTERHGLAEGAAKRNGDLVDACDRLLIRAIRETLPKAGPRSLDLLIDPAHLSLERTSILVALALEEKAFPTLGRAGPRHRKPTPLQLVVPIVTSDVLVIDKDLASIVPREFEQLSPGVHPDIVGLLTSRTMSGYGETHIVFDEMDALLRLRTQLDANPRFPWADKAAYEKAIGNPTVAKIHLDVIWKPVAAKRKATKTKVQVPKLPDTLALPGADGNIYPANSMFIGSDVPTRLPGNLVPRLVDPALAAHPLLGRNGWNQPTFTFDEFLLRFSGADRPAATRLAMFVWVCQNLKKLQSSTWPAIRKLAIWPDANETPLRLEDLCLPVDRAVDSVLGGAIRRPSKSLLSFASAVKKRKLGFSFRQHPTPEEVGVWIDEKIQDLPRDRPLNPAERTKFRNFEDDLVHLLSSANIADSFRRVADLVPALNMDGNLARCSELVRDHGSVTSLKLQACHLIDRKQVGLDKYLPPLDGPNSEMVRLALDNDPHNSTALIPRLRILGEGGQPDLCVSHLQCIPVHGEFRRPNELAFKGNKGNFWGDWRDQIGGTGLSDVDQRLYRRAGVISSEPTPDTSLAFFRWLAMDPSRAAPHLPQIIRHFGSESGPRAWWEINDGVPCLPVSGPSGYRLVGYGEATKKNSLCFVDDFPELGEALQLGKTAVDLVVTQSEGVRMSIAEHLLQAGVKSLRAAVGQPKSVRGSESRAAPDWAMDILREYQSRRVAEDLQKALVGLGVSSSLINTRWYGHIGSVKQVLGATEVIATYKFGRINAFAPVRHAFDPDSGTLWLAERDEIEMEDAFFDALAERIFVPNAPGYCATTLERALRARIRQAERLQRPSSAGEDDGDPVEQDDEEVGEAPSAHYDWRPDPSKNIPKPGPISKNPGKPQASTNPSLGRRSKRAPVPNEAEQIQQLKEQYAWHCQAALATKTPAALAPAGSYVEYQENRKRLIDAHHPDLVEAGGVRHAGNIIVLSHMTHHRYGRHLSRQKITDALKAGGEPRQIKFGSGKDVATVNGVVISMNLAATNSSLSLYFTDWHRKYWLENA